MPDGTPIFNTISQEVYQLPETRTKLYRKVQSQLGKPIVCYFTSQVYPVMIQDSDADMLEAILRSMRLENGFALVCSSLGGDGLTAERIINICRSYSGTGSYDIIVPGKAKSAATVICFGAQKIIMSKTSELGPIDPQIVIRTSEGGKAAISAQYC